VTDPNPGSTAGELTKSRRLGRGELLFAGLLLAIGVLVFFDTQTLPPSNAASGIGPAFFPRVVAVVAVAIAVTLVVQVLRGGRGHADEGEGDVDLSTLHLSSALIVIGAVVMHSLLLERAGYIITAALTFWAIAYAIGSRRYVRDALLALAVGVVVYVVFTRGLSIRLPAGVLEGVL
jgi:putative tricarboxylic transport membrane protein